MLVFNAAQNFSEDTNQLPSPAIWDRMAETEFEILTGLRRGVRVVSDWSDFPLIGTQTTQIAHGKYKIFSTTAGTTLPVNAINSVEIGGLALERNLDTDNDSASIAQSYAPFRMSGDPTKDGKLCFECAYTQNSIATNMAAMLVGLAEVDLWTLATGVPFNGGDAITNSAAFIGYHIKEDGLGKVHTAYSDRATALTLIGEDEGGTIVPHTFRKFGFIYDPDKEADCITFYVNNLKLATKVSKTALQALTNLDTGGLGLIWSNVADSGGTSFKGFLRWWKCVQVFPNNAV